MDTAEKRSGLENVRTETHPVSETFELFSEYRTVEKIHILKKWREPKELNRRSFEYFIFCSEY
jgi:hypothetical protein